MKRAVFLGLAFLCSAASAAEPVRVIDGDGFELTGQSVRLHDFHLLT